MFTILFLFRNIERVDAHKENKLKTSCCGGRNTHGEDQACPQNVYV